MHVCRASLATSIAFAILSYPLSLRAEGNVTPPHVVAGPSAAAPIGVELRSPKTVLLEITVAVDGGVVDAVVIRSDDARLDGEALERAKALRFAPAERDGEPVAARIRYSVRFAASAPKTVAPREAADGSAPDQQKRPKQTESKPDAEPEIYEAEARVQAPVREATRHTVRGEDLTSAPGTRGDAFRAIEALPGVSRPPAGDGQPILRGVSGFESAVMVDGVGVPLLYHFGGLTSVVSSRLLDRIDVYPSNFSVRYGRVYGGVIDAHTRDPQRDRLHAVLDLSLLDSSALVEGPLGSGTGVAAAVRRSNLDLYFGALASSGDYSVVAAPVYWDYQLLAVHELSARHRLRMLAFGSRDSIELMLDRPVDGDPVLRGEVGGAVQFHRLNLQALSRLGDGVEQSLTLSLGQMRIDQNAGPEMGAVLTAYSLDARAEWRVPIGTTLSVSGGLDAVSTFYDGEYAGSRPPQLEGDPSIREPDSNQPQVALADSFSQVAPAAWLELAWTPIPEIVVTPGVRVDYFRHLRALTADPRLSARLRVAAATTLKGGVGLFTQQPVYFESLRGIGNPDLSPARGVHQSVGVEQGFGELADVSAEVFQRRLFQRVVATRGGTAPYFENDGSGRVFGLELLGRLRPAHGTRATVAYTLSRSERRDHDGAWRAFDQDQTHNLVATFRQALGAHWELGARFRLVTGNPTTPIAGSVVDASTGLYRPLYGAPGSERDPTFHQLDLLVQKTWRWPGLSLNAYLDLQNAYNAQNAEGRSYSYDYSKSEPVSGLPIFPNFGLRGEL